MTANAFQIALASRFGAIFFLLGKALRTIFFLVFLLIIVNQTKVLAGYTTIQTVFFFLTFTIMDNITQLLFREVYRFRPMVVSGTFDLVLTKPINPLFRILAGGADVLDLFMLAPYIASLIFVAMQLGTFNIANIIAYLALLVNGLIIALSFHILVAALGVLTTEIDHTVMIYRDILSTGRVPVDIYREPLRSILTFIIPVGIMVTYPVQAFLGILSWGGIIISFLFSSILLWSTMTFWQFALTKYASASS